MIVYADSKDVLDGRPAENKLHHYANMPVQYTAIFHGCYGL